MLKWRYLWLALWVIGILFPMAWIGKHSTKFLQVFDAIFAPEWMHWVMHAFLIAGLAVFVLKAIVRRVSICSFGLVLGITLVVAGLQEGWQVISGVQILGWNSLFDLGVDMVGAVIGFGIVIVSRKLQAFKEGRFRDT